MADSWNASGHSVAGSSVPYRCTGTLNATGRLGLSERRRTRDPNQLYRDVVVAIDPRRGLNNGQPSGVATWLHFLELQAGGRVLHVGCGLGYYTAIIAAAVAPGEVIGVELDAALASKPAPI
jgi:hypothetical protein